MVSDPADMSAVAPNQIVYLEQENSRLYAEVIQVIEARCLYWARPLLLIEPYSQASDTLELPDPDSIHALTEGPDLLWPIEQFQIALDTDLIPLMSHLQEEDKAIDNTAPNQRLRRFMERLSRQ